jgi:hypothetical protein
MTCLLVSLLGPADAHLGWWSHQQQVWSSRSPTVEGKSSNAKQGARQSQALSRMMVVDNSVRLRRPQASMVLIW